MLPLCSMAQEEFSVVRGHCMPDLVDGSGAHRAARLPAYYNLWDADKTYHQLVILVSFRDTDFSLDNPMEYYDKLFNEPGFNEERRNAKGCLADYFRDQSAGMFNLKFDVYGPVLVDTLAQPYAKPTENTKNYGKDILRRATLQFIDSVAAGVYDNYGWDGDFAKYDWNNNGIINQVIYIYAGIPGNVDMEQCYGHIWPNTGSFTTVTTPGGKKLYNYSASGERWPTNSITRCGLGTIAHEFSHSLGLPDIYPSYSDWTVSVCDEWDLMDGGNFTNYGFCPPNYTALEKYLLGWVEFTDLTEATTVTDLKPVAEGGEVYRIKHSDSEWYLLENRQQRDWDQGVPGKGLVIYHVNYDGSVWSGNSVNNSPQKPRFYLVHADNKDYDAWDKEIGGKSPYAKSPQLNSRYLSTSPYPYVVEGEVLNNQLTDASTPAAVMYYPEGALLDKPITNITMTDDGLVSFDFMGGTSDIGRVRLGAAATDRVVYDLQGRRVLAPVRGRLYVVRSADGTTKKLIF